MSVDYIVYFLQLKLDAELMTGARLKFKLSFKPDMGIEGDNQHSGYDFYLRQTPL